MNLEFPDDWRYTDKPAPMPDDAVAALTDLVDQLAAGAKDQQAVYEIFKSRFGMSSYSSNADWAQTDMQKAFGRRKENAALFVAGFWAALDDLRAQKMSVPPATYLNGILERTGTGYRIDEPHLRRTVALDAGGSPASASSDRYTMGEQLGEGGFGQVFRATRDTGLGSFEFAVKVHRPSPFTSSEKALKRFEREVRALQKLQHRGIVPYLDAGVTSDGAPFLVMPLVRGKNIRDATEGKGLAYCSWMMTEVLRAVAYAHSQEVLHRDLKPNNILVRDSDHQPIILDFGLAYLFEDASQESLTNTGIGTGPYVPHEVVLDPKRRTNLHDIYSCGVIFYELLGRRLPDARDYAPLAEIDERLQPADRVILKALAPARQRHQSAEELLADLQALTKAG